MPGLASLALLTEAAFEVAGDGCVDTDESLPTPSAAINALASGFASATAASSPAGRRSTHSLSRAEDGYEGLEDHPGKRGGSFVWHAHPSEEEAVAEARGKRHPWSASEDERLQVAAVPLPGGHIISALSHCAP